MTSRIAEPIVAIILCVLSVFAWMQTGSMSSGASIFPRMIVAALGLLSVIYLVRSAIASSSSNSIFLDKGRFTLILLLTVVYVSSFTFVGYFTATFLYIQIVSYTLGFKRVLYTLIANIAFIISVYVLFVYVFRRAVPRDLMLQMLG